MSQPLSIALPTTTTKTAMPEIADKTWCKVKFTGTKEANIVNEGEPESEKGKPVITFSFELVDPVMSKDGLKIEPGKPGAFLFERIYLRDKNNLTSIPERAVQSVGRIQDALDNTGDQDNTNGLPPRAGFDNQWVAASVGKVCMVHVVIDGQYGNKIKEFASTQDQRFQVAV